MACSVSGPMILHATSMAVIISLRGRAVGETAKSEHFCRIDTSCWFKVRSDLLITHLSLMSLVSCSSTSTTGMRVRSAVGACDAISLANLFCCLARHFSHSALCAYVIQLVTSVCMSLGNDVNNSSFMSAIKPLNVLILKFISFILTFKSALCVLCMMLLAASPLIHVLTRRLTCVSPVETCHFIHNISVHRNGGASSHKARPRSINSTLGFCARFCGFPPIKKLLGRSDMRTRARKE